MEGVWPQFPAPFTNLPVVNFHPGGAGGGGVAGVPRPLYSGADMPFVIATFSSKIMCLKVTIHVKLDFCWQYIFFMLYKC